MDKFLIRAANCGSNGGSSSANAPRHNSAVPQLIDLNKLPRDPAKRKRMVDYHPNQREEIRRKYLLWGPHQPRQFNFPYRDIGKKKRRFIPSWFDQYANWLEYSEKEDKTFCLCCYLFRDSIKDSHHGHDAFVIEGFNSWNKTERFAIHVGDRDSFHNKAVNDCEDLLKINQSIPVALHKRDQIGDIEHLIRLNAAIDVCRYLLHQGQPFRGHDESKESENKGNYLELMEYTMNQNDVIAKAFKNAPLNNQLLSPAIQRDITECFGREILGHIMEEILLNVLHMMMMILALTNGLSKTLQRKDKDIVNAISDVESVKRELKKIRSQDGWESLLNKVHRFCEKHDISAMDMEKDYVNPKKPRQCTGINNEHHYQVDCFFPVLDLLGKEFNERFNEVNSELLLCMSALSPCDLFSHFDKEKLIDLAKFYPEDFDHNSMVTLERELGLYIDNVLHDERFATLEGIGDLAKLMVVSRKHLSYPLVYRLLKLALTLPVATASVERCFSAMKIVKNALRNKIGDEFMSFSLICFVEKELLDTISNEIIVARFHKMKGRRGKELK